MVLDGGRARQALGLHLQPRRTTRARSEIRRELPWLHSSPAANDPRPESSRVHPSAPRLRETRVSRIGATECASASLDMPRPRSLASGNWEAESFAEPVFPLHTAVQAIEEGAANH